MLHIRPININDDLQKYIECINDLNSNSVIVASNEQIKRNLIKRSNNIITYVIADNDLILATATVIIETKLRYTQPCCHIEDVGVHPEYRGKGYGKMIVNHCLGIAKSKKCYKVKLFCSDNLLNFYSGMGFKKNNNGMEKNLL